MVVLITAMETLLGHLTKMIFYSQGVWSSGTPISPSMKQVKQFLCKLILVGRFGDEARHRNTPAPRAEH